MSILRKVDPKEEINNPNPIIPIGSDDNIDVSSDPPYEEPNTADADN